LRVFSFVIIWIVSFYSITVCAAELKFIGGSNSIESELSHIIENAAMKSPDSLSQFLVNEGYLDNEVIYNLEDDLLVINLGPKFSVGNFIVDSELEDTIPCHCLFNERIIDNAADSVLSSYQARGYYYTSISSEIFLANDTMLNVHFVLNTGPVVEISNIQISGLKRTDKNLIRRYIPAEEGDTLRPSLLTKTDALFKDLSFIRLLREPEVIPEPGYNTAIIQYSFAEKAPFYFEGSGGYIPENDGYFIWYLDFMARNLFGGGQRVDLMYDKREENNSVFKIAYGQPLFILGNGYGQLAAGVRDYRDRFYEFGIESSYRFLLNRDISLKWNLAWKNVEPANDAERHFQAYETAIGVQAGDIDNTRGESALALEWEIRYSGRHYDNADSVETIGRAFYNDTRNQLKFSIVYPVWGFLSDYHQLILGDVESSEEPLPLSEQFLFGGPTTLRGYRTDQFAANRFVILRNEWHFFFSRRNYIYPFLDGAWYERFEQVEEGRVEKVDDLNWGFGIGINLSSEDRNLRFTFAWEEGAPFDQPRLGIVLGSLF